jgi:FAD/FMN-containing dehydrogenase
VRALRSAPATPIALELVNQRLAAQLGLPDAGDGAIVLVRLAGNAERVAAERAALAAVGEVIPVAPAMWSALRHIEATVDGGAAVLRWSQLPALLAATWAHVRTVCEPFRDALVHASIARGIVRAVIPHPDSALLAAAIADDAAGAHAGHGPADRRGVAPFGGTCVPERLPARLWGAMGAHPTDDPLSRRVRRAFDPAHVLNPGLLGEGGVHA